MNALLLALLACSSPAPTPEASDPGTQAPAAAPSVPQASIYDLAVDLEDQDGDTVHMDHYRGHPTIVSMFYASCPTACPILIGDVQALEHTLAPKVLADSRVLLISLDPKNDSPEVLREAIKTHELDTSRWTLARPTPDGLREVAAVLGVRYRALVDGGMNHSSILTVIDGEGHIVAQQEGLGIDRTELATALGQGS